MKKFRTIWHYAIAFFENEDDLYDYNLKNINGNPYYIGKISDLSYDIAKNIAPIHENCLKYYEYAMMLLFRGEGKLRSGTENPVMALESFKSKKEKEGNYSYVIIWKIVKFE